jgi:hypothetical protein
MAAHTGKRSAIAGPCEINELGGAPSAALPTLTAAASLMLKIVAIAKEQRRPAFADRRLRLVMPAGAGV